MPLTDVVATDDEGTSPTVSDADRGLSLDHERAVRLFPTNAARIRAAVGILLAIALPFILQADYNPPLDLPWTTWQTALNLSLIASITAAALNVLQGYSGQASVAHVAFLIVGSITAAHFGERVGLSLFLVLPLAWIIGAAIGVLVGFPALRIRGLYLFMATLALHFIAVFIFREYQVEVWGFSGVVFAAPSLPDWMSWIFADDEGPFLIYGFWRWYWVLLPITGFSILIMKNLMRRQFGRSCIAVRENDVAAALLGIDVRRTKLTAFAITSGFIAMSGVLLSYYTGARTDEAWTLELVIDFIVMIILGGFATIAGGVLGAFFFYGMPIWLNWARSSALLEDVDWIQENGSAIDALLYGLAIVLILIFKPAGLAGLWEAIKSWANRITLQIGERR